MLGLQDELEQARLTGIREQAAAAKAEQEEKEAPQRAASAAKAEEDTSLEALFARVESVDEPSLDALCDLVKARLGVNSVYVCRKEATEGPDESGAGGEEAEEDDGEGGGAAFQIRYVGASSNAQAIKTKHVVEPAGVTFDSWKVPAAAGGEDEDAEAEEEEEEDEEGGAGKKAKEVPPPPELPVVHVRNVLRERRMKLHELPRLGEYVAVPLRYASLDHPGCFPPEPEKPEGGEDEEDGDADAEGKDDGEDEAAAEGKEEDGAAAGEGDAAAAAAAAAAGEGAGARSEPEPVPAGVPLERHLAICFDTLGQDRRVGSADVELVKRWAAVLASALERTEQAQYEVEFRARKAAAQAEAAAVSEAEAGREEDAAAAAEAKATALEDAGGDAAPEDTKALLEASERASVALAGLNRVRTRLEGIASSALAPAEAALTTLHTACRITGSDEAVLGDTGARSKTRPFWGAVRRAILAGLADRMAAWKPEEAAADSAAIKPDAIAAVLEGVDADAAKAASIVVLQVLDWCKAAGEAAAAAAAKAAREAEEAEAAAAAEAERAAAEAAEGGEAAAGEGGEDEDDEE
jgi:hypothetical protein